VAAQHQWNPLTDPGDHLKLLPLGFASFQQAPDALLPSLYAFWRNDLPKTHRQDFFLAISKHYFTNTIYRGVIPFQIVSENQICGVLDEAEVITLA
jgi:hypothetical protein